MARQGIPMGNSGNSQELLEISGSPLRIARNSKGSLRILRDLEGGDLRVDFGSKLDSTLLVFLWLAITPQPPIAPTKPIIVAHNWPPKIVILARVSSPHAALLSQLFAASHLKILVLAWTFHYTPLPCRGLSSPYFFSGFPILRRLTVAALRCLALLNCGSRLGFVITRHLSQLFAASHLKIKVLAWVFLPHVASLLQPFPASHVLGFSQHEPLQHLSSSASTPENRDSCLGVPLHASYLSHLFAASHLKVEILAQVFSSNAALQSQLFATPHFRGAPQRSSDVVE